MSIPTSIPPHVRNLDIDKTDRGPLGPSKAPPEPLFETDDDVLPDATTGPPTGRTNRESSNRRADAGLVAGPASAQTPLPFVVPPTPASAASLDTV